MSLQPNNSPSNSSPHGPWSQSMLTWRQRVGYYLIGAAVSLVLMGFWVSYRSKVREQIRAEQEAREVGQPKPVPGVPLNPSK